MPFENSAFGEVQAAVEHNLHLYRQVMKERRLKQEQQEAGLHKVIERDAKSRSGAEHPKAEAV